MPTNINGFGYVDDQGNKSISINLSNCRKMTNTEYQQLSQDERAGAIIVTDYPIPEESDEVSVTADGNTSWRELLNELYTKIDFSKINENTVFYRSDDNFWFALTRREGNNTLHFGGAMNYGTYMRTFGFELTSSASYFIRCDSQDSGNTNFNQSSNNPGSGTILKVIYNYYKNQDIHTEYLASKCMMPDGVTSVEEAIDNKTDKGIIIYKKFSASYVGAASYSVDLSNAQCVMITYRKSDGTDSLYTVVVPIGVTVKLYTGESREFYRSFTTSTTGVSWTASSDPNYPNAFVLPQFVIAF